MKPTILAVLFLLPTSALAEMTRKEALETCTGMAELARTIMESRQIGVPMSEVLAIPVASEISDLTESMIYEAYNSPAYQTPEYQQQEINNFGSEVEIMCLNATR